MMCALYFLNFASFLMSPACPWPFQLCPMSHLASHRDQRLSSLQDPSLLLPWPGTPCLPLPAQAHLTLPCPVFFTHICHTCLFPSALDAHGCWPSSPQQSGALTPNTNFLIYTAAFPVCGVVPDHPPGTSHAVPLQGRLSPPPTHTHSLKVHFHPQASSTPRPSQARLLDALGLPALSFQTKFYYVFG